MRVAVFGAGGIGAYFTAAGRCATTPRASRTSRRPPKPRPSRLRIATLAIDAPVVALGVAPTGAMQVPSNADTVAWYGYGPSPGQPGSAVLAAHVDYNGRNVFFRLGDLRAGDMVIVDFADGGSRTFVVRERASVAKEALVVRS